MTAHSQKPKQKRLHSCVLTQPKWVKIHEKIETRACRTLKISDLVANANANANARVANAPENGQPRRKTNLLGKYPIKITARDY